MKKSGVALLATIISIAVLLLVSGGFFTIMASNTGLIKSGGESLQAQYFAQLEADTIKMLSYDEVDNITQDTWQEFDIDNSWQYKVNVGPEQNVGDSDNTIKIASISVRKNGDTINRFALDVPLSSQGSNTLPVGTILPYVGELSKIPHGWGLCDGTNGTPNLTGRFLQGWGWDDFYNRYTGEYIQEGLPNIYGNFPGGANSNANGAFTCINSIYAFAHLDTHSYRDYSDIDFNAARCSWLYGNSLTIQPRAFVVYYIMRII